MEESEENTFRHEMNKKTQATQLISESVGLRVISVELTSAGKKMRAYHSSVIPFTFCFKGRYTWQQQQLQTNNNNKKNTIQKLQNVLNIFGSTYSYCLAINITTEPTA